MYADRDAFRIREGKGYRSISYTSFVGDVMSLAAALEARGLARKHLALLGENSYQWVVSYFATVVSGGVIIPIDKELSIPEVEVVISQSNAQALFCSDTYSEVSDSISKTINIEHFAIHCDESDNYTTLNTLLYEGATIREANSTAGELETPENPLAAIVFTSGTTGFSKGVMLSKANFIANLESAYKLIHLGDCVLSVLPMHHTYEFTLDILYSIYQGLTIAINNSIKYFSQNLKIFAPTDILIVPLVAESLYANIWQNVRNSGKEKLFRKMITMSNAMLSVGIDLRRTLFKAVHEAFGGRLNSLFIGGAYLDPEIACGFHALGFKIHIGYGITECSPLVAGNILDKPKYMRSCGPAIPDVSIRIDSPNENGEGEIEVQGESVMMGYYNDSKATDAVMHDEWFRTGDIGRIDKKGMLYITGRVKNLIVLKNGKNIYPEELENLIARNPLIKEVVVSSCQNSAGEELAIAAEIFIDQDLVVEKSIIEPKVEIQTFIESINKQLPYYKRITKVNFRDEEFPKTTTKKIKRYK